MKTKTFLEEVSHLLACDRARAEAVTSVVLQELHRRLTDAEARDVAAQLPKEIRALWDELPDATHSVSKIHRDEFIGRVRMRGVLPSDSEAERSVRAVFHTLQRALGSSNGLDGEAGDVYAQLPKDLKSVWLEAVSFRPPEAQA